MATKLRKMHLTSVDLVRAGANQEADICLFKSADGQNGGQQAAQSEEELFKQFLDWKQEQATEGTCAANVEKSEAELYVDAISKSVQSICEDEALCADEKLDALSKSCSEFNVAALYKIASYAGDYSILVLDRYIVAFYSKNLKSCMRH